MVETYAELRGQIFDKLGRRCVHCGQSDVRVLQIDHRYGGGADERRDYKGLAYLRHIIADIDTGRYQILCASCNILKRVVNFECVRFNLDVIDDLMALADEYSTENPP